MHKMRIRENGLAVQAYAHQGDKLRQIAVVFPGLPYVPGLQECGRFLFSLGFDVVQPQYTGTYDSDGVFSPRTAIQTVDRLRDLLSRPFVMNHRGQTKIAIESDIEFAAAHSFGTWVLANAFVTGFRPGVLLLLSPYLGVGADLPKAGSRMDLSRQADHLRDALPFTFRLSSYEDWKSFYTDGKFAFCELGHDGRSHVIGATGEDDPGLDPERTGDRFRWFVQEYHEGVSDSQFFIVPSAGHDEADLLVEPVLDAIRQNSFHSFR
jgi:hypothetical protein